MELIAHRDAQSLWPEQESVRKTCTTSSMPECWKSIAPRERGKPHRCVIVIKDCPCHQMHADEYSRYVVDGAAVAEMKGIIERHQAK